jgi:predicted Zn-dependent protease
MYNLLVKIELARNNHRQAAQDAILGLRKCPNGGEGLWHRLAAVYLIQTGKRNDAKAILELGLRAFPNDPNLARLKGMI